MPHRRLNRARRQGFTLMEVLLVLVILVVLMGFAVPSLLGSKKKADIDAARTQIGLFRTSLEKYHLDMNGFPATEQGLDALVVKPGDLEEEQATNWSGPYITTNSKEAPKDPWGHKYSMRIRPRTAPANIRHLVLGPDGKDGSEDDIVNGPRKKQAT